MSHPAVRGQGDASERAAKLWKTSTFLKSIMAVTGFVWVGFLVGHVGTNLHLFGGPESINEYYAGLKANTVLFWGVRIALASSVVAHIAAAIVLMGRNRAARPIDYRMRRPLESSLAARTMRFSGPLVGFFIVYHLLHLTTGQIMPAGVEYIEGDDYHNIVASLAVPGVAAIYVVGLALVGMHLWHGAWAGTMSLGLRHPRYNRALRVGLPALMLVVIAAMLAIPVAVIAGWL